MQPSLDRGADELELSAGEIDRVADELWLGADEIDSGPVESPCHAEGRQTHYH